MKDQNKTKAQLIEELAKLRQQLATLEADCAAKINLTEHRQIVAELQQSERRYRAIVEDQTELICRVSPEGTFNFVNEAYAHYYGKTVKELIGQRLEPSPVIESDQDRLHSHYASLGVDKPTGTIEHRVQLPNGDIRWQHWTDRAILDEQGQLVEYQSVGRDITEHKQAEEALHGSKQFIEKINDTIPFIIYSFDILEQRNIYSNQQMQNLLGYSPQEIAALGPNFLPKLLHPDDLDRLQELLHRWDTATDSDIFETEYRMKHADGSWRWFLGSDTVFNRAPDGRVKQIIGAAHDITERRQTEQALQESEQRFRTLVEGSIQGILVHRDTKALFANRAYANILGYDSPDEILAMDSVMPLIPPYEQERLLDYHAARIKGKAAPTQYEFDAVRKDGSIITLQQLVTTMSWDGESAVLAAIIDITERKQAEEELRFQKMLLECQSEASPDGISIVSNDRKWLSFNRRFIKMWDIPDEVVESRSSQKVLDSVLDKLTEPEQFVVGIEYLYQHPNEKSRDEIILKDGRVFERHSSPVTNEYGENYGRVWYYRDITEHKRMEVNLHESKQRLQAAIEGSLDEVFLLQAKRDEHGEVLDFVYIDLSLHAERQYGLTRDDLIGRGITEVLPNNRAYGFFDKYVQVLESGVSFEEEYFIPDEAIAPGWWRHQVVPMGDGIAIFNRNITAQKQAEVEIQKQHTLNEAILDAMAAHIAVLNRDGVIIATNESWKRFAQENGDPELQHADIGQNYLEVCRRVRGKDIEDAQSVLVGLETVLSKGEAQFSIEYNCHSSTEQRWFLLHCSPLPAKLGGAVLVHTNITELKQVEFALRASKDRFRNVISSISDHIYVTTITEDGSKTNVYLSPNVESLLGYPLETFLDDWSFWMSSVIHVDDRAAVAVHDDLLTSGDISEIEYRMVRADGQVIWVRDSTRVVDDGGLKTLYGVVSDITDRKLAEDALRQQEEELRRRNQELILLNQIIVASAAGLEPEDFLKPICRELALILNTPQVAIAMLNQEKAASNIIAEYRADGRPPALNRVIPIKGNPTARYVFSHKKPLVVGKAQDDPRLASLYDLMEQRGTASLLIVPLIIAEEVIGTLAFETSEARIFSSEDINLAWSVAGQVAGALAQAEHAKARRMLSAAIEQSADSVIITDTSGVILYVNPAFEINTGYSRSDAIGQNPSILNSGRQGISFYRKLWATINAGEVWSGRFVNKKKDGTIFTDDAVIAPVHNENGDIVNYVALQRDMTRMLQLEEQLRQSQKMEAIGRLAGGVAHDFNNLLTIILGHTELLAISYLNRDDPRLVDVNQIRKASERASLLTRQLLAFSRQQPTRVQRLNLNEVITNLEEMLRRLLGEDLNLITDLASDLGDTMVDPTHLEQIIINIVINARDAMPGGGQLTLRTANTKQNELGVNRYFNLVPGPYITLSITDTGLGMDEETRSHIFEPFFTTKGPGKGTGLGLAIVYGIVEQNKGHIEIESELGRGTTFKIYLPQVERVTGKILPAEASVPPTRGNETVLLVEDEDGVRLVIRKYLERQGYTVLEAAHAEEALLLCQQREERLDLLITDVVMPDISGPELAGQLAGVYPGLKCLFISGYADEELEAHNLKHNDVLLLEKPFSSDTLAFKVREALKKSR